MNTCKTCKWWGVYYENVCDCIGTIESEIPATRLEIDVRVHDDQGLEVYLITGSDFGCILHSPKEVF